MREEVSGRGLQRNLEAIVHGDNRALAAWPGQSYRAGPGWQDVGTTALHFLQSGGIWTALCGQALHFLVLLTPPL